MRSLLHLLCNLRGGRRLGRWGSCDFFVPLYCKARTYGKQLDCFGVSPREQSQCHWLEVMERWILAQCKESLSSKAFWWKTWTSESTWMWVGPQIYYLPAVRCWGNLLLCRLSLFNRKMGSAVMKPCSLVGSLWGLTESVEAYDYYTVRAIQQQVGISARRHDSKESSSKKISSTMKSKSPCNCMGQLSDRECLIVLGECGWMTSSQEAAWRFLGEIQWSSTLVWLTQSSRRFFPLQNNNHYFWNSQYT